MIAVRKKLLALVVLALVLTGCTDNDLATVSKALRDTAQAVSVFQTAVIDGNAKGLVSENVTRQLMLVGVKVNTAGHDAVEVTRNLNKLEVADRGNLLKILGPLITELQSSQSVIAGITNEQARTNINAALALIQATLNTAQLALATR